MQKICNAILLPSNKEPEKGDILLRHLWKNTPIECRSLWQYNETVVFEEVKQYTTLGGSFRDCYTSFVPQYLYILSDDEIKEGDWVIRIDRKEIWKVSKINKTINTSNLPKKVFKIIATNNPDLIKEDIPPIDDGYIKEYCSNAVEEVVVEYEEVNPTMYYDKLDSRGDYIYYCPKCHEGGSYMGIINEKDIPHCYKKECSDFKPKLSSNGSIIIKPVEETWKDINDKFMKYYHEYIKGGTIKLPLLIYMEWLEKNYNIPTEK